MLRLSVRLRNRASLAAIFLLLMCCGILGSCGSVSSPTQPERERSGEMSITIRLGKTAAADISRAEIVVTGEDMAEIRQNLTISGNTITGSIRGIPAGSNRLFTLNGYNASGAMTYTGSGQATIVAGKSVTVRIEVRSVASAGGPVLAIGSAVTIVRYSSTGTSRITGELLNTGTGDATGVTINFRARNSSGAAISDATVTIGTVRKGVSSLFSVSFSNTDDRSSESRYLRTAEYTISYNEGASITGTVTIQ